MRRMAENAGAQMQVQSAGLYVLPGEPASPHAVQAAKELYKDQSANVTEYPFKAVNNPIAMLDENGEQMVRDGEPVFIDDIYLILSKSTAKEMLNDQMFRIRKDGNEMNGNIATIPMTQIEGLDGAQNHYLGSPELMTSLNDCCAACRLRLDWLLSGQERCGNCRRCHL